MPLISLEGCKSTMESTYQLRSRMNTVHGMSKIEFIRTDAISLISKEKKNDCASEGCVASVAPKLESTPSADER